MRYRFLSHKARLVLSVLFISCRGIYLPAARLAATVAVPGARSGAGVAPTTRWAERAATVVVATVVSTTATVAVAVVVAITATAVASATVAAATTVVVATTAATVAATATTADASVVFETIFNNAFRLNTIVPIRAEN